MTHVSAMRLAGGAVRTVTAAALLLSLIGCSHHAAFILSEVDPAFDPSPNDPVWVTLSTKPTIRERQVVEILNAELAKNGFNVVLNPDKARWVLGLSADRRTVDFGTTSSTIALPINSNLAIAHTNTRRVLVEESTVFLYLFNAADFRSGRILSIWEGQVSAPENVYKTYAPAMLKQLLDVYGRNFERTVKLSKAYVKN